MPVRKGPSSLTSVASLKANIHVHVTLWEGCMKTCSSAAEAISRLRGFLLSGCFRPNFSNQRAICKYSSNSPVSTWYQMLCVLVLSRSHVYIFAPLKLRDCSDPLRDASLPKILQQFQKRPAASTYICIPPLRPKISQADPGPSLPSVRVAASRASFMLSITHTHTKKSSMKKKLNSFVLSLASELALSSAAAPNTHVG